jgi:hypothetical protein
MYRDVSGTVHVGKNNEQFLKNMVMMISMMNTFPGTVHV